MTKNWSVVLQTLAMIGQTVIPQLGLSSELATSLHAVLGALSVGHVVRAHRYNTDGTSETVVYVAPLPDKPYIGWTGDK